MFGSRQKFIGICVLALSAAGAAQQIFPLPQAKKSAQNEAPASPYRFELIDNRIFVNARLNGHGPFHFILDSGADGTLVRPEVAKLLALKPTGTEEGKGNGADQEQGWQTRIDRIELAGFTLTNQEVAVLPFNQSSNLFGSEKIDGILGLPAFQQAVLKIDYEHRTLSFTPFDRFIYTGSGKVLTFSAGDDIPTVFGNLDGIPGNFGIDTGLRNSLMLYPRFVESNLLREKYSPKVEGVTGWGFGGPVKAQVVRAQKFTIGGLTVPNVITRLMTEASGTSDAAQQDGIIGSDLLKRFSVIFDYKHHQIILEPNGQFDRRDSYDRAGMWVAQQGTELRVVDVVAGGPAAQAGIKPGDTIVAVNGVPAKKVALPELREKWRDEPPGTKVHLTLSAGDSGAADPPPASSRVPELPRSTAKISAPTKEVALVLRDLV